jgi:ubiquitin carboxyl-terminal hydrolase 8
MALQRGVGRPRAMRVGIDNPGVHCFANSAFQALFATPGFGREMATGEWEKYYKNPPMRKDDKLPNPQELTRCIHRVFARLHAGTIPSIDTRDAMVRHQTEFEWTRG